MRWSSAKPTVPGWYWVRQSGGEPTIRSIVNDRGLLIVEVYRGEVLLADYGGEWSERIPPPEEA